MRKRKIPTGNRLIKSLSTKPRDALLRLCTSVDLEFGSVISEANQPYQYLYFPLSAFISSIAAADHPPLEMGLIGNEGMVGASVALGIIKSPLTSVAQGSGSALRIPLVHFQNELKVNPRLTVLLHRYLYILIRQLAQAAVCVRSHQIEARIARWLLMTGDRANSDTFLLTHVFLAQMLGVRRSGVSIAANRFRDKSLISYARGNIHILNRRGLKALTCSCYEIEHQCYQDMAV